MLVGMLVGSDARRGMLVGICNPDALNIRIFNPIIALQMLIFNTAGLQIRPNATPLWLMTERHCKHLKAHLILKYIK